MHNDIYTPFSSGECHQAGIAMCHWDYTQNKLFNQNKKTQRSFRKDVQYVTELQAILDNYRGEPLITMQEAFNLTWKYLQNNSCGKCPLSRFIGLLYMAAERIRLDVLNMDRFGRNILAEIELANWIIPHFGKIWKIIPRF